MMLMKAGTWESGVTIGKNTILWHPGFEAKYLALNARNPNPIVRGLGLGLEVGLWLVLWLGLGSRLGLGLGPRSNHT